MTVRVTTNDRTPIATFATATTTTLLLYTVLAAPGQRQGPPVHWGLGGHESMQLMNIVSQPSIDYIFDENVTNTVKFHRLADEWKRERGALSTAAAMAALPSYRRIMGMGKEALPFIFSELKAEGDSPSHWFLALTAITDENPVPAESRGKLSEMAKAWLAWGKKAGYVE